MPGQRRQRQSAASVRSPGTVAGIAALPTFNPGTSQSLSGNDLEWGFKTSFRDYVLNVGGPDAKGSLQTLDGAGSTPAGRDDGSPRLHLRLPVRGRDL